MKDPDDPGTFDMASVWGEVLPPAKAVNLLIRKDDSPIIAGDEQKENSKTGPTCVDSGNGQDVVLPL